MMEHAVYRTVFLRAHGSSELSFTADLTGVIRSAVSSAANKVEQGETVADALIDVPALEQGLVVSSHKHIVRGHVVGAALERANLGLDAVPDDLPEEAPPTFARAAPDAETTGRVAEELLFDLRLELSPEIVQEVIASVTVQLEQPYWRTSAETFREAVAEIIADGIQEGVGVRTMASQIRERLDGPQAAMRALRIARTETTAALNAGSNVAAQELRDAGVGIVKRWVATLDDRVRPTHLALDSIAVGEDENFDVGGFPAPYPAHVSLPAKERVNCRCARQFVPLV